MLFYSFSLNEKVDNINEKINNSDENKKQYEKLLINYLNDCKKYVSSETLKKQLEKYITTSEEYFSIYSDKKNEITPENIMFHIEYYIKYKCLKAH